MVAPDITLAGLGIRAISFDLDDTLWPLEPVIVRAEQAFYGWLEQHCPRLTQHFSVQQLRDRRIELVAEQPALRSDVTRSRALALRSTLRECDYDANLADQAMAVFQQVRNEVEPYADVSSALQDLSFHYRLGSVTNGNADVSQTSIGHYFDSTLAATVELPAKPAADMFARVCRELAVSPSALLHIGDNPGTDVGGARDFGCRTGWINRHGMQWPADIARADIELTNLAQLVAMAPPLPGGSRA